MALDEMFGQFRGKSEHLYPVKHLQENTDRASQTNSGCGTGGNVLANPDCGTRANSAEKEAQEDKVLEEKTWCRLLRNRDPNKLYIVTCLSRRL